MTVTALLIILSILLALFWLLMLHGNVTVEYRDAVSVRIKVLGIPFWQHPKKKKKIKLSDYTPEKIAKRNRREERKQARKLAKRKKQLAKKAKKGGTQSTATTPSEKRGLLENLGFLREIVTMLLGKSAKHIRLRASRIIITVATDDAAKTAILFGAVNQAVVALIELLDQAKKWHRLRDSEISVKADFTAEKSTADISITLSLRVWQMLSILFHTALSYIKGKTKSKSTKKQS